MKDRRTRAERERARQHEAKRHRRAAVEHRANLAAELDAKARVLTIATLTRHRPDPDFSFLSEEIQIAFRVLDDGGTGVRSLRRLPIEEAVSASFPGHHVLSVTETTPVMIDQRDRKVFIVKIVTEDDHQDYRDQWRETTGEIIDTYDETRPTIRPRCRCRWCRVPHERSRRTDKQALSHEQWYPREDSNP